MVFRPKVDTAPKIGIEIKKDILAASTLLKHKILDAVIAIPDLLTPGISDNTWNNTIKIDDLSEKSFFIFFSNLNLSLIYIKIPNKNVVQAITSKFLNFSINLNSTKKKPTIITGIDDNKILGLDEVNLDSDFDSEDEPEEEIPLDIEVLQ